MEELTYLDFDLMIERSESGYRVRIINSPAGQADANIEWPFSDLEIENFLLRIGNTRRGVRRLESTEMKAAREFGGALFNAVFDDEVRGRLRSSLSDARRQGAGLRFRLHLTDVPELADLPWEYLYDSNLDEFLVLSVQTPLIRYIDLPRRTEPLTVELPLRILVMISSPSDYPELDVEQEFDTLVRGLGNLQRRGVVKLVRLEKATLAGLQRQLRKDEYHIFHYIGHGGFDEQAQDGVLLLEDDKGRGRPVSGRYLGTLLHDQRLMRMAVLNACEGARTSRTDPFAGVAHSLVQKGIPAVIAMQFEITDEAAITLASEFYGAMADGYPVDASLSEARKAIFAQNNDVEWGKPVLYMRSPDGRIFTPKAGAIPPPEAEPVMPEPSAAELPIEQERAARSLETAGAPVETPSAPVAGPAEPAAAPQAVTPTPIYLTTAPSQAMPSPAVRRSIWPWILSVFAVIVLGLTLLISLDILDPRSLIGRPPEPTALIAAAIAPTSTETIEPTGTAAIEPTHTARVEPPTEVPTEALVVVPTELATDSPTVEPGPTEEPTIGPTPIGGGPGQIAFASDRAGRAQIWLIDVNGGEAIQLTNRFDGACQPSWSPDGSRLVFTSPCTQDQDSYPNAALYLINADGSGERRLTDGIGGDYDPAWSPDGSLIAFASDRADFTSIFVVDPDSGAEPIALTRNSPNRQPVWSPDCSQIALVTLRLPGIPWQVFTMPRQGEISEDGGRARQFSRLEDFSYSSPRWSPDGENLIFTKQPAAGGQPDILGSKVSDIGLKEFRVATGSGRGPMREPDYSPDGKWLVFEGWPDGVNHDIWIMTANGADRQRLTQDAAEDFDAAWRPSGELGAVSCSGS